MTSLDCFLYALARISVSPFIPLRYAGYSYDQAREIILIEVGLYKPIGVTMEFLHNNHPDRIKQLHQTIQTHYMIKRSLREFGEMTVRIADVIDSFKTISVSAGRTLEEQRKFARKLQAPRSITHHR